MDRAFDHARSSSSHLAFRENGRGPGPMMSTVVEELFLPKKKQFAGTNLRLASPRAGSFAVPNLMCRLACRCRGVETPVVPGDIAGTAFHSLGRNRISASPPDSRLVRFN